MAESKAYSVSKAYEVKGNDVVRKNKVCPKCAGGTFMATHKGRSACGKCGYTELAGKDE